ncbi:secondary thiamine-phosphate synthase enzyme YjbQ [Sporomusa aerivorans]|uniref:secondary thiamine-phosphate synthase enzyme YjbQ n=1 Tax=Sporomusa aerivorans TaxID=204936 RepID=UPI00352B966A
MEQFSLNTPAEGFIDITARIREYVRSSRIQQGICQVFVPHTTAGITVNENADPDVVTDMLAALGRMVPDLPYRHCEGNSPAHIKSSLVGCSVTLPVVASNLVLGTWQGVYFCEFDGPRRRDIWVQVVGG